MKVVYSSRENIRSATIVQTLWLMLMGSALLVVTAYAADPSWWGTLGNSTPHAVATQGQLKWFTQKAVDDLNAHLTNTTLGAGAGDTLSNLVAGWADDYSTNGYTALNPKPSDRQVVTIGQVKYIASLYYGRLSEAGYTAAWPSWLYPDPAQDANAAVVGQLKTLFNFDATATVAAPTDLTATTLDDGSVDIDWQESSLNVTGYTIQSSDDGSVTWIDVATTTADITDYVIPPPEDDMMMFDFMVDDVSPSTSYRVVANNGNGSSSASGSVTPPDPGTAPVPPSNLTVTSSDNHKFTLNWQDNSGGTASFVVKGSKNGGTTWTTLQSVSAGTTSATVSPNPSYLWIFQVFASASGINSKGTDIVAWDGADTDTAPGYALVDLAPGSGMYVNDSGQAVYQGSGGYTFWSGGSSSSIGGTPVGLNNGGTVGVNYPDGSTNNMGDFRDGNGGLWSGSLTPLTYYPHLLYPGLHISSDTNIAPYPAYDATNDPIITTRGTLITGLNDGGTVIGSVYESGNGPYWEATQAVLGSGFLGDVIYAQLPAGHLVFSSYFDPVFIGGNLASPTAINNSGTAIGTFQKYTPGFLNPPLLGPLDTNQPPNPGPVTGFVGSPSSPVSYLPIAINDNGDIVGGDGTLWLHGHDKRLNGPGEYVNNRMQTAHGWYHGRNLGLPVTAPGWSGFSGVAISHNTGIIVANATKVIDDSGNPIPSSSQVQHAVELVPADWAPPVVRVNSNFDEQKVNSTTGYAQPDNYDEDLKIAAGHTNAGKITVTDLSPHFFGIKPGTLPTSWYSGATVTIKKLDNTDPETGLTESGRVRLYAIQNLGQSGETAYPIPISTSGQTLTNSAVPFTTSISTDSPANLVSALYGSSPTIPQGSNVTYWMEGIDPGPITLEFRVHNAGGGNIPDIVYTQNFLVCTQQSKADWQKDIRQEILLQSGVDMNSYAYTGSISAPFITDKSYIQVTYAYYQEMFSQKSTLFSWCGLAKLAGADVYGAMSDAEYGRTVIPPWLSPTGYLVGNTLADYVQNTLVKGNYEIFDDLAWQYRAYQASGIWALRYTSSNGLDSTPTTVEPMDLTPWEKIYQGDYSSTPSLIVTGTGNILQREQRDIAQRSWNIFHANSYYVGDTLLSVLTSSPLPSGASFTTVMGSSADVTVYADRWNWINDPTQGMWQQWNGYSNAAQVGFSGISLQIYSEGYSLFYGYSSSSYPIIW